ncbi:hypothetical protein APR41_00850 [Salegentibacter salinarum]|uniref:Uncharacterized protein n=1 Tax=Salegentibacter salinarum TaxID=447422 RepID=A0A2N0U3I5_9FLAO|nr:hypothetical protein [Salegentibacter salinarum]PKD21567.1 hypothetical protein APR41_00850 [Salegentibacter salinarum]SKB36681.1 hypothetical protein SAMN05660903_00396 [Salegentibacter salinarum]
MKNRLKKELVKLAEEIISEKENLDTKALKLKAATLYEQLSILNFTEQNLKAFEAPEATPTPKIEKKEALKVAVEQETSHHVPDGTEYREDADAITEPNTEKIKDIVAQMPAESERVDELIEQANPKPQAPPMQQQASKVKEEPQQPKPEAPKNDFRNIGVDYDNLPDFEPLNNRQKDQKPRSVNDRLKKGINIGLNERLSFIKNLFDGNSSDYNRVLSQLNTFSSLDEAQKFIQLVVKPDYNHWQGKEDYEERFMAKIENKFQ